MAIGDIYFTRVRGTYLSQEWVNTYWYRQTAGNATGLAAVINTLHRVTLYNAMRPDLSTQWAVSQFESFIWEDPALDYASSNQGYAGTSALDPSPSFLAMVFRSPKGAPGQRYSYTRLCGFPDTAFTGNNISTPSQNVVDFANAQGVVQVSGSYEYERIQVSTSTLPPLGTGVPVVNRDLLGDWEIQIGTQNSRKP